MARRLVPRPSAPPEAWVPVAGPIELSPVTALRPGCYRLALRPYGGVSTFHGALRVERRGVTLVVEPVPRMPGYTHVCYAGTFHDERGPQGRLTFGRVTSRLPHGLAHLPAIVAG